MLCHVGAELFECQLVRRQLLRGRVNLQNTSPDDINNISKYGFGLISLNVFFNGQNVQI